MIRAGIVGAGRTRNGTGPFLAMHFEAAGGQVVALAGRTPARAEELAAELGARLGHSVTGYASVAEMLATPLEGLIIASPPDAHLEALRGALAVGVPVFCEKPLLGRGDRAELDGLLDEFLARDLLLVEGCQWPMTLPAFGKLFPEHGLEEIASVAMRLSPARPEDMLSDSLSHLLSIVQAVVPVTAATDVSGLRFAPTAGATKGLSTEFVLQTGVRRVACVLELVVCPTQPRPAWLRINGRHAERQIELPDYRMSFQSDERSVCIDDPTAALVYRFAQAIREANNHDRIRTESEAIRQRARIYDHVLDEFERGVDR